MNEFVLQDVRRRNSYHSYRLLSVEVFLSFAALIQNSEYTQSTFFRSKDLLLFPLSPFPTQPKYPSLHIRPIPFAQWMSRLKLMEDQVFLLYSRPRCFDRVLSDLSFTREVSCGSWSLSEWIHLILFILLDNRINGNLILKITKLQI